MDGGFLPEPSETTLPPHGTSSRSPAAPWQDTQQQPPTAQQQRQQQQQPGGDGGGGGGRRLPPPPRAALPPAAPQQQPKPQQAKQQARPGIYRPLPPESGAGLAAPPDPGLLEEHPEAGGGCSRCSSLSFNAEWLRAFGVVLCNSCRRDEPLISKATARQRYSVSDGELRALGSLRKANPHKKDWQAMHLYMESQVARLAHDKYGGAEGLAQHQQAHLDAQLRSKLRKREEEKTREAREGARLSRIRQRISDAEAAQRAAEGAQESEEEEI